MNNLIFYSNCRFLFHIIYMWWRIRERKKREERLSITFIYLSIDEALLPWKERNEESELKV